MAAKRIGAGAVIAAGISRTCNGGGERTGCYPIPKWGLGELDVLFDKAFQWMKPDNTAPIKVLWYGEYITGGESLLQYEFAFNDAEMCTMLIDNLKAKGYAVDNTMDDAFTQINSDLLEPYDILVIPQMQLGDASTGGDPDLLPDADVQAIKDFVEGGGGLFIMDGNDRTYCFHMVQNKVLEALDFGIYFQHDSITDTADELLYVTADVNTSYFGENYQSEAGKTTIRLYRVNSLAEPGPGVVVDVAPEYQSSVPDSTLVFSVTVTNKGTLEDNFTLSVTGTQGWGLTLENESLLNVPGPNKSKETTLRVTIPSDTAIGVEDNITVTATSLVNANVSGTDSCIVRTAMQITPPVDDSQVVEGSPDTKYGSKGFMYVGSSTTGVYLDERAFLKFDLSEIPATIPPIDWAAADLHARLHVYCFTTSGALGKNLQVCSVANDDWSETEISWNNQPSASGSALDTCAVTGGGRRYVWDVTSYVQNQLTGDKVVSFCIKAEAEGLASPDNFSYGFDTKEYGDTKLWPYLEFVSPYQVDVSASPSWLQDASPGGTLTYNIIITNTGFLADSYSLSVADSQDWGPTIAENQFTNVQPDQSRTTTLTVTISSDASICTKDKITVTATGTGVSDNVVCEAHAFMGAKLSPIADAHVAEGYPNSNYGSGNTLYLQSSTTDNKNERIFLKFDLSTISSTATIIDAEVWLWCRRAESADINAQCRKVTDDTWSETLLTWGTSTGMETGNVLDTVALKFLPPSEDTWISWDVTSFVLSEFAGNMKASFCIKAETEGTSGQYTFNSKEWPNENERPYLKVTYPTAAPSPGVDVSISPPENSAENGRTVTFTATVTNTSDVTDTYTLENTDTAGWTKSLSKTSVGPLAPDASDTAILSVTIPADAESGDADTVTVTATSQENTAVKDNASCIARCAVVEENVGVQVTISESSKSGNPGETLDFLVTVKNTGASTDTFTLTATDTENWGPTLSVTAPFSLDAGESRPNIKLSVTIPSTAAEGDSTTITVTATGTGYSDSASCTATASAEGISPLVYVGVAVIIVVIIAAVLIVKPF